MSYVALCQKRVRRSLDKLELQPIERVCCLVFFFSSYLISIFSAGHRERGGGGVARTRNRRPAIDGELFLEPLSRSFPDREEEKTIFGVRGKRSRVDRGGVARRGASN